MISLPALDAALAGLAFGLSLIVAIGAQNSFVLRQGAMREHVGTVVAICAASDVVLIAAGVAGAGAMLAQRHGLMAVVRALGAALLLAYAGLAARRALAPGAQDASGGAARRASRTSVAGAALGFTWLNPAVYLDTVILLGSVAADQAGRRWWFGAGAAMASVVWFVALGFGARLLTPLLSRPAAARVLDGFVAVVMAITALRVALGA